MKLEKRFLGLTLGLLGVLLMFSCKEANKQTESETVDKTVEESSEYTSDTTGDVETETAEYDNDSSEQGTVVDVAVGNENFSTLVAAVKAAGLAETLGGSGPFTVFAPVNNAFDQLPDGTVDGLLKPESKDKLGSILKYHVVSGKVTAAELIKSIKSSDGKFSISTLQGGTLIAQLEGESVTLTDEGGSTFKVVQTDVMASNGIIHAIDNVAMPTMPTM